MVTGPLPFAGPVEMLEGLHEHARRLDGKGIGKQRRVKHWWFAAGLSTHLVGGREGRELDGGVVVGSERIVLPLP